MLTAENVASRIRQAVESLNNALADASELRLAVRWTVSDTFTAGEFSEYGELAVKSISREEIL